MTSKAVVILKVQVEVSAPDVYGRREILAVLLRPMVTSNFKQYLEWLCIILYLYLICKHVKWKVRSGRLPVPTALQWISLISARTTGWTGSDLAGLIRSASSFALQRYRCKYALSSKFIS